MTWYKLIWDGMIWEGIIFNVSVSYGKERKCKERNRVIVMISSMLGDGFVGM